MFESPWDVFSAFFLFIIGAAIVLGVRRHFSLGSRRALMIYAWHTVWSIAYYLVIINIGGDALGYYDEALMHDIEFHFGTSAIVFITAILVKILKFSFFNCFLFFNILGVLGLVTFDASLRQAVSGKSQNLTWLATLIVFLPSVSFWSSALGKDSIAFMSTGFALWAAMDLARRYRLMAFSVMCMLLVRPHMAGLMVLGLGLAVVWDARVSRLKKIVLGFVSLAAIVVLVPLAINYAGLDASSFADVTDYIEKRQSYNMEGGGGVDISSMNLPMQALTYLFRPLFFDANSVFQLAASLDNLILLFLFVVGGWRMVRGVRSDLKESRVFMWGYAVSALLMLAMTTANLGIAVRQKWMFVPMLILLFISVMGRRRTGMLDRGAVVARSVGPRSLPDFGDRREPSGKARPVLFDFEAHSGPMQRESGQKWTVSPTGAADRPEVRQAPGAHPAQQKWR